MSARRPPLHGRLLALLTPLALGLLLGVSLQPVAAQTGSRPIVRPEWPEFIDVSYDQATTDYREPAAVEFGGSLFVGWVTKQPNPDLGGAGGTSALSRVLYVREMTHLNGQWAVRPHAVSEDDPTTAGRQPHEPWLLTPDSADPLGHGNHQPFLASHDGKVWAFWQSGDPAQKPPGEGGASDILYRTYDPSVPDARWSEIHVANHEDPAPAKPGDDFDPYAVTYGGSLCLVWDRTDQGHSQIWTRCNSPTAGWGTATMLSSDDQNVSNEFPSLAVFKDRLVAAWHASGRGSVFVEVDLRIFDGVRWGPLEVLGRTENPDRSFFATPSMVAVSAGQAGLARDELFLTYPTLGGIATRSSFIDTDIVVRRFDGTAWDGGYQISPGGDRGTDNNPQLGYAPDGFVYLAWETLDDGTASGKDTDIVYRTFSVSTEGWSSRVYQASRPGDAEDILPDGENTAGDDQQLRLFFFQNRLAGVFRSFDAVTGRSGSRDIIVRFLSDFDNDGDGFSDSIDRCPSDAKEHLDSDGDGVCDGRDDFPNDPTRVTGAAVPDRDPLTELYGFLAMGVLGTLVVVALYLSVRRQRRAASADPAPASEAEAAKGKPSAPARGPSEEGSPSRTTAAGGKGAKAVPPPEGAPDGGSAAEEE